MKTWRKKVFTMVAILAAFGVSGSVFLQNAFAATGQIYLTPASSSVQNGENVTLSLRINPGTTVDGVQATVYYDAAKLQYVSYSAAGSAFSVQLQQSQSAGTITVARGDFSGGISTDSLIETITFKALVGTGSAALTVSGQNATSGGAYTDPGAGNATVNFTTPATQTCPSGYTGTYPNCTAPSTGGTGGSTGGTGSTGSTGSGGGTTTTPKPSTGTTTTPKPSTGGSTSTSGGTTTITSGGATVSKENVQYTKAVITVTSATPTKVYVKYGIEEKNLFLKTPETGLATSHEVSLDPASLLPGQRYYYSIVSTDQAGKVSESSVSTIKLKGMSLKIALYDAKRNPIAGKQITIHSDPMTAETDKNGVVTFADVSPGAHTVIYKNGGKEYKQQITVTNNVTDTAGTQTAELQNFSVVYDFTQTSVAWGRYALYVIILLIVAALIFFFINRQRKLSSLPAASFGSQVVSGGGSPSGTATVMTPDSEKDDHAEQLRDIPNPSLPNPGSTIAPQNDERRDV